MVDEQHRRLTGRSYDSNKLRQKLIQHLGIDENELLENYGIKLNGDRKSSVVSQTIVNFTGFFLE